MNTVVWDVDDVLNDLMHSWFELHWLPRHPDCPITYSMISENPPHLLLGVSVTEYLASLDTFRLSEAAREMAPVPEVLGWFRSHGGHFRHIALTATPMCAAPFSAAWVMRHFGWWIRSFSIVPSVRAGEVAPIYDNSKQDFLRWWGKADILVDDNAMNIAAAQELGISTVLIPRPWNGSQLTLADALETLAGFAGKEETSRSRRRSL